MSDSTEIRPYRDTDLPAVIELLSASLGWVPDDQHVEFFSWKHVDNPFGSSPAWVATDRERVVGFRTFLRWEFVHDGAAVAAVRAVDTATHPDYQGRGIFSRLTLHALDRLREQGVAFVFNTPNERSRPGYLKMGWQPVARLPVQARVRSLVALGRLARARTAAGKWSVPSSAGMAAVEAFSSEKSVSTLLDQVAGGGMQTRRSASYLAWRFGYPGLGYRVVAAGAGIDDGVVVFRVRRRGPALEAAICEELVPDDDRSVLRGLLGRVLRETGADHAVRLGGSGRGAGFLPVPGQGPTLVWRAVAHSAMPPAADWRLSLGDVELF